MKPFSNLNLSGSSPNTLIWKQPRFSEEYYELGDDPASEALYATIGWPKWLSDLAVARSAAGTWHFDRLGWTRRRISMTRLLKRSLNLGMEDHSDFISIANFEVGWFWEGDIVLRDGKVFHWYRTKPFRNSWALTEVIPDKDENHAAEMETQGKPSGIERKRKGFRPGRRPTAVRREQLVYEIEFGMHWLKQEAWITLPTYQAAQQSELIFLLCTGMYLGYCYNQDNAAAAAVCVSAAVS